MLWSQSFSRHASYGRFLDIPGLRKDAYMQNPVRLPHREGIVPDTIISVFGEKN